MFILDCGYYSRVGSTNMKKSFKQTLGCIFLLHLFCYPALAVDIHDIKVEGNRNVSEDKILRILRLRKGDPFEQIQLTEAVKRLFATKEFADRMQRLPGALLSLRPDVVCLQEVWMRAVRRRLIDSFGPTYEATTGHKGGLLILSRFPIERSRFERFTQLDGLPLVNRLAGKGYHVAWLKTPLGPLVVINSHLSLPGLGAKHNRSQMEELLASAGSISETPVILGADLNLPTLVGGPLFGPEYGRWRMAGFQDANPPRRTPEGGYEHGSPTRVGWPRPPTFQVSRWSPDYVFFRSGKAAALSLVEFSLEFQRPETALSDHNLLRADLLLAKL